MQREWLEELAGKTLALVREGEAEVTIFGNDGALTRFANNQIEQHVHRRGLEISVRVLKDGRVGKASTNMTDESALTRCVRAAEAMLPHMPPDPEQLDLPGPQDYRESEHFDAGTAECAPERRAQLVRPLLERARKEDVTAAGILSNGASVMALANSRGLFAYNRRTEASYSVTVMTDDSAGWAREGRPDMGGIDYDAVVERAMRKAVDGRGAKGIEPGEYDVVLEPAAVGDLLLFFGWAGFGGQAFVEGRSFMSGKIGEKLLDEKVTMEDDAYHPLSGGVPFDFEGMPRRKVTLIERGVARSVVHSRKTAKRAGVETTGHGLPEPNAYGALPLNLLLHPGGSSLEEMIASTERGILVTQFHYTNVIDPMKLVLTGITRSGTFWIENGKVSHPIKNLRFTESMLKAFSNVEALGKTLYRTEGFFGGGPVVPAVKIRDFRFTSVSEST